MSFQDFGNRQSSAAPSRMSMVAPSSSSASPFANSSTAGTVPPRPTSGSSTVEHGALNQISESLLQYQRNVDILEKIVVSLTKPAGSSSALRGNKEELELQYRAQADVIEQLGQKVHDLIHRHRERTQTASGPSDVRSTLQKLERDFDRVRNQAGALTKVVDRLREQQQVQLQRAAATAAANHGDGAGNGAAAYEQYQQQVQIQMEEDRLAEQIMREREDEIRQINRGMHQVNEIYKDLAHLVATQQDSVDAVEKQMDEAKVNADSGLKQIEKANEKYGQSNCVIS